MADDAGPYHLSYTPPQIEQIANWLIAAYPGQTRAARQIVLLHIEDLLRTRPTEWGDPYRNLPALRLTMYRGLHSRVVFFYAVDEDRRIVYVREIRFPAGPGSPDGE